MEKMRIGLVVTPIIRCPPEKYGGIERIVWWLGNDLVSRGHEVTLFAREGSYMEGARVIPFLGGEGPEFAKVIADVHYGNYFDVLHDVTHDKFLTSCYKYEARIINTLQGIAARGPNTTCISHAQRRFLGYDDSIPVIYNRVPTNEFVPVDNPTMDYLLYMGTISDFKGTDICIDIAIKTRNKLKIAGPCWEPEYFDKFIKPRLSDDVQYIGDVGGEEKLSLIQNAKALFHPVRWCEAGAIIVSEALSCGVPIIGSNNGVLPELVSPAVGKIATVQHFDNYPHMSGGCYSTEEMIEAVETIDQINRNDCAEYARQKLDCKISTDEYIIQYERIRNGERW